MEQSEMENFMESPLLKWLRTLPDSPATLTFNDVTSGPFLHNVLHSFDANIPNNFPGSQKENLGNGYQARVSNINSLVQKLQSYYEDVLGQCVVISLPDPLVICQDSPTSESLEQMDKLLLLILGAAVQCSQKEHVIASIKNLPFEMQHAFVEKIREVTENPKKIWSSELDDPTRLAEGQKDDLYLILVSHVKRVCKERDSFANKVVEITLASPNDSNNMNNSNNNNNKRSFSNEGNLSPEKSHMALEVAEQKAKIRKLNQELEEKSEGLLETREELEKYTTRNAKLKSENLELVQEARAAKTLRDELDILRERANKVDKLEAELQRFKDKVNDVEFYKSRVEELREDNKILVETKIMLEDQLEGSRKRSEQILSLESEIMRYRSEMSGIQMERDSDKARIEELAEENLALQMSQKNSMSESQSLLEEMQSMKGNKGRDTNILTEQIDKDVTRIHRLEYENQKLRSDLENLKVSGFHETNEKILNLEKVNKKLEMGMRQLELLHSKDSEYNVELEREVGQIKMKHEQKEQVISALKESEQTLRIEKETEIENLNKLVESLRKRQKQTENEQLNFLEEENKKMAKEHTKLQTKLNKIEHEKARLVTKVEELQNLLESLEEMKMEKEKLNSKLEHLCKENEDLKTTKVDSEEFEKVQEENKKVGQMVDKLRTENNNLHIEKTTLNSKVNELSRKTESLKLDNERILQIEGERDELRDKMDKMKISLDSLKNANTKLEAQEQKVPSLTSENNRLKRQLKSLNVKNEDLTKDCSSMEAEILTLKKAVDSLKIMTRKVEDLEKENIQLESSQDKAERMCKNLTKDVERLKQSLETKEAGLEEQTSKCVSLEREKIKLERKILERHGDESKLQTLEQENRKLAQDCAVDKRALARLTEELVEEKIKCDNLSTDLESLRVKLERLGINQNILDGEAEWISKESLDGSLTNLLENRNKKISNLETSLKNLQEEKANLAQQIELLKLKVQAGNSRAGLEEQLTKVVKEKDSIHSELIMKNMEAESIKEKMIIYEEKWKKMHEETVEIQVENSTLQSQSSSLLAQINQLQTTQGSLETFRRQAEEREKQWKVERSDLLRDQSGLQKLHENLQQDYDALLKEHGQLKDTERRLKADLRKLQSMSLHLNEEQEDVIRAREAMNQERDSLRADARTLNNLRSEHARLKEDFRSLFTANERFKTDYCTLQTDYKNLKTNYNQMKLQQTEKSGELHEAKEQLAIMDVEHSKALNRCEVLAQMNNSLEEDREGLMNQVQLLLGQCRDLLTQTLDDKEHFHEEEKNYTDRVNNLSRQKEKLEEKIIEQYKRMDNFTPKKIGFGDKLMYKMKKATTTMIGGAGGNRSHSNLRNRSNSRGRSTLNSNNGHHNANLPLTLEDLGHHGSHGDSSSIGSGCGNEESSLDSSNGSPHGIRNRNNRDNNIPRSESALELRGGSGNNSVNGTRKISNGQNGIGSSGGTSNQMKNAFLRKSMINSHLEDSDGNNADNDSVSSLVSGTSFLQGSDNHRYLDSESVITQDTTGNLSYSSHSDIGIPLTANSKNERIRSVSRIYVNGSDQESQRSTTPKLTSWKSTNSSPILQGSDNNEETSPPPVVPARKQSRDRVDVPPRLPPKPGPGNGNTRKQSGQYKSKLSSQDDDSSTTVDEDNTVKENAEWYEYGCV